MILWFKSYCDLFVIRTMKGYEKPNSQNISNSILIFLSQQRISQWFLRKIKHAKNSDWHFMCRIMGLEWVELKWMG